MFYVKINDKIFKNNWKISFLGHFWSFLPKPDFSVKIPQAIPQGALIPCQTSQKTNV